MSYRRPTDDERAEIMTITFRNRHGIEGAVTGLPISDDKRHVQMFSAGILDTKPYVIAETSTILSVVSAR